MRTVIVLLAGLAVVLVAFGVGWLFAFTGVGQAADLDSLEDRELAFTERMRDVVLVGYFTVDGRPDVGRLPDRYEIAGVTKLDGNRWRFETRVQYLDVDVTVPVVVPIEWAGDTPMVSLTGADLPGLGEGFDSRVLFYDERYAGTWDHGEVGGLMYGAIVPRDDPRATAGHVPGIEAAPEAVDEG